MVRRFLLLLATALGGLAIVAPAPSAPLGAQGAASFASAGEAREALAIARRQQRSARARGERLERQAAQATQAAERAAQQAAALAARIQQAEAAIAASEAELALVNAQRRGIDRRLADRREPLVRLTAALQGMARRPLVLSALQPGSLDDLVHTRAVLAGAIPQIRRRTADLRGALDRARQLEVAARGALAAMRQSEDRLGQRRRELVALAARERFLARRASGGANREAERALVLAEDARDLDSLVGQLEQAGRLRAQLAALPGPMLRPARPGAARMADTVAAQPSPVPSSTGAPARYQLPVAGRIASGFGAPSAGGVRQAGIALVPRPGAQAVAPGAGRIAFAGPYRGYGSIVIIEHPGDWTSLVTGLAALDVTVGQRVNAGSPLGRAPDIAPQVTLELRRAGEPVNPLDHTGSS